MHYLTGIGILESSLPIQFFIILHRFKGQFGFSGTLIRRCLTVPSLRCKVEGTDGKTDEEYEVLPSSCIRFHLKINNYNQSITYTITHLYFNLHTIKNEFFQMRNNVNSVSYTKTVLRTLNFDRQT